MNSPTYEYNFPEQRGFYAMEVTEPEFNIMERKDWFDQLFVDFSALRKPRLFDEMKFALGIRGNDFFLPITLRKLSFLDTEAVERALNYNDLPKRFTHQINILRSI